MQKVVTNQPEASGELTYYENKFLGIQFDVNDQLSLSYHIDESDKNAGRTVSQAADGATAGTKTVTGMEQKILPISIHNRWCC